MSTPNLSANAPETADQHLNMDEFIAGEQDRALRSLHGENVRYVYDPALARSLLDATRVVIAANSQTGNTVPTTS